MVGGASSAQAGGAEERSNAVVEASHECFFAAFEDLKDVGTNSQIVDGTVAGDDHAGGRQRGRARTRPTPPDRPLTVVGFDDAIAELYEWLAVQFPPRAERADREAHFVSRREQLGFWRDELLHALVQRGTESRHGPRRLSTTCTNYCRTDGDA
ncbi:hypothetical protein GCM10010199_00440 [Dactylosporangium roseum]